MSKVWTNGIGNGGFKNFRRREELSSYLEDSRTPNTLNATFSLLHGANMARWYGLGLAFVVFVLLRFLSRCLHQNYTRQILAFLSIRSNAPTDYSGGCEVYLD